MSGADRHFRTPLEKGFEKIATPFEDFAKSQVTSSTVLLGCAVVALVLANSGWAAHYERWVQADIGFHIGNWTFEKNVRHWINDALMALFFFVIGLEIKRELLAGELRETRRLVPLLAAALGGMVFPALIYYGMNPFGVAARGWGIPMATDTAFALGVLALLGSRVPNGLMTFLAALAIVDDIGAVLVIAIFYTEEILLNNLAIAGSLLGLLVLFNILGVQRPLAYFIVGALVWAAVLESGVHATVAGVLVALTIPARPKVHPWRFLGQVRDLIAQFERKEKEKPTTPILADQEQHAITQEIQDTARLTTTPLQRWEHALERPVALLVLPIFAFANAGIPIIGSEVTAVLTDPITLGVLFGLVLGKFLGITAMGWLALKTGAGELPDNVRLGHLAGVGLVAGMGFTMSMFIAGLGFETLPEELLRAKTGILAGSLIAGVTGAAWVWLASSRNKAPGTGQTT